MTFTNHLQYTGDLVVVVVVVGGGGGGGGGGIYFDLFLSNDWAAGVYIMYKYFIFKLIFFGKYFVKTTAWVDILA